MQPARISGTVTNLLGLVVEVEGLTGLAAVGDRLELRTRDQRPVLAEVIGFHDTALRAMAYGALDGLAYGSRAYWYTAEHAMLDVADSWIGRVIDPLGNPLDGQGPGATCVTRPYEVQLYVDGMGPAQRCRILGSVAQLQIEVEGPDESASVAMDVVLTGDDQLDCQGL